MLQFEELRLQVLGQKDKLNELREALGLEATTKEIARLEAQCAADGFWDDPAQSQVVLRYAAKLKGKCASYEKLAALFEDVLAMIEMANEEEAEELLEECRQNATAFGAQLDAMTLSTLLTGAYDGSNAILTFHAGTGGTEAMDWNEMLVRMYTHWAERHGYHCALVDFLDGEEAGLKSAVLEIKGENAYGFLKSENGVHRLVRCSPFDSSGRRHTSFASLEVMPEIDDSTDIEISADDIKMDVYRASGAGGQKVNKTSSAVRLTHIPTGIVTSCQVERSQHQNREVALRMLKSKLIEIKERQHLDKIEDIKGVQMEIAWGSQIRSYVFMPYQLAKDHRTNYENGNIQAVMDGDLDGFINAYLKLQANGNV
ncbi:MAG: peptide chain release factor 2 [Oscillospiraceae bacterium]|jgi:peptide chain release factor 2|nr:peptide chain release factor 2 [Oscillospiraceae bacterium]